MAKIFNYVERKSLIHSMTGASKLICLLLWTLSSMITFDTRFLIFLSVFGFILFPLSHVRIKDVKSMFILLMTFMVVNGLLIYLFSPQHGVTLYGSKHVLLGNGKGYSLTAEQLLYQANVALKYTATVPLILVYVASTSPSELAASLNQIGLSYSVSYSVALAMRYIPDTVSEYRDISRSQQARGIEMSRKENLLKRIKAAAALVLPLILSSVDHIDVISNAMELRKFGTGKKRTWIMGRKLRGPDYAAIALGVIFLAYALYFNISNGSRFWNPWKT